MSKDKHKSRERRLDLLQKCTNRGWGEIWTNCEGGMPADDPDLERLARDGHMVKQRKPAGSWRARRNVTIYKITDAGRAFLLQYRLSPSEPEQNALNRFLNKHNAEVDEE